MNGLRKVARKVALMSLVGQGDFTAYSLSKMVGLSDTTCRKHLRRLAREGFMTSEYVAHRSNVKKQVFNTSERDVYRMADCYDLSIPYQRELF